MNVKPLGDRIIVEPVAIEEKVGSIYLAPAAQEKPVKGIVRAVGAGKMTDSGTRLPMEVKEGQTVLYGKYSGAEQKIEGTNYLIMRENDILAIFE